MNCTPTIDPAADDAVALTIVRPETDELLTGAVRVTVTGDVDPLPLPVFSDVVKTSKFVVPSVHARPTWPLPTKRLPVMNARLWDPLFVPGATAHGVHVEPLNFVKRMEFAASVLMKNSHTLDVPSVAPKSPPPDLNACPAVNAGSATERLFQLLPPTLYWRPSIAVPAWLRRNA